MFLLAYSSGVPKKFLFSAAALVLLAASVYVLKYDAERLSRVVSFTNPGEEGMRDTDGYQLWNSLLALGSGGWTGVGFME